MAFHDVRIDEDIERGATGGPSFRTIIQRAPKSAKEVRVQDWQYALRQWQIGYSAGHERNRNIVSDKILTFFLERRGRLHSFRFRDWTDYQAVRAHFHARTGPAANVSTQLGIWYGTVNPYWRKITKPVAGTISIYVNNAGNVPRAATVVPPASYSIDYLTGIATIQASVFGASTTSHLYWSGEFDLPVRFDTDDFEQRVANINSVSMNRFPIIEVDE